ncbi:hypothetical protein J2W32_004428 [Variovorax boronicumulans]|uniref:Uncharacterized protein n=1 Tax=Variovorax boronicumulans TaxID=436515 RepID=A0AAW8CYA7_9BURK|nr:hypothetical protein [Variovorax boronicumulans]MDP9895330.1 hypothetical protein [Variovorax boronicumulans]MDQ0055370.1 hypothetical protein [Variovorax boronicumulans]
MNALVAKGARTFSNAVKPTIEREQLSATKLQRACTRLNQAIALLDLLANCDDNQACWGASRLLDMAAEQLARAINSEDSELAVDGRAILFEALTIMAMIADSDAALPIAGVITLAGLVRDELNGMLPATS